MRAPIPSTTGRTRSAFSLIGHFESPPDDFSFMKFKIGRLTKMCQAAIVKGRGGGARMQTMYRWRRCVTPSPGAPRRHSRECRLGAHTSPSERAVQHARGHSASLCSFAVTAPTVAYFQRFHTPCAQSDHRHNARPLLRYARVWPKAYATPARTKSIVAKITDRHSSRPRSPPRDCLSPKEKDLAPQNNSGPASFRRNQEHGSRESKDFYDTPDISGMAA